MVLTQEGFNMSRLAYVRYVLYDRKVHVEPVPVHVNVMVQISRFRVTFKRPDGIKAVIMIKK